MKSASSKRSRLAVDALAGGGPVQAVHLSGELQQLAAGELLVKVLLVRHVAQVAAGLAGTPRAVDAADPHVARVGLQQADEHADGRRLAGAVGPQQGE